MQDIFECKILRLEGFPNTDLATCQINLNGAFYDTLSPIVNSKTITLDSSGTYELVLTSKGFTKGVSFNTSIFIEDGAQWLPLFDSNDFIEELPEEVQTPRMLFIIFKLNLKVIEESGVYSEENSGFFNENEEFMPEIKLIGNTLIGNTLIEYDKSQVFTEAISEISHGEPGEKTENLTFIEYLSRDSQGEFKDFADSYEKLVQLNRIQSERLDEYDQKFAEVLKTNKEKQKNAEKREEALLLMINERESELSLAHETLFKLRGQIKRFQYEIARLKETRLPAQDLSINDTSALLQEVLFLRKTLKNQVKSNNCSFLDKSMQNIPKFINDSDTKDSHNSSVNCNDDLDEALKNYCKENGIPGQIVKDKEQIYCFNQKKIPLTLKNGKLYCRVAGGFKLLKEYLEGDVGFIRYNSRKTTEKSIDSEYDADNYKKVYKSQNKMKVRPHK